MSVTNGQYANETSFNDAFMSRNSDTDTSGKVSLLSVVPANGNTIDSVQKYINLLGTNDGTAGEDDTTALTYSSTFYIADGDSRKVAIGKIDTKLQDLQDQNDVQDATLVDHEARLFEIESDSFTFVGEKTFQDNVIIQGNLTVEGTTTTINSTVTEIVDPYITLNNGGDDASSEGSGIEIERTTTNAALQFDSSLASKFKIGLIGSLYEVIVSGVAQSIAGLKDFLGGIKTDSIDESTLNAGVTVETVLIKDGLVDGRDVSVDGTTQDSHIANTSNPHSVTKTQVGLGNVTDDAQLKRAAGDIDSFTEKVTLAADDWVLIEDSADSFNKKKAKKSAFTAASAANVRDHVFKINGYFSGYTMPAATQDNLYRFDGAMKITNATLNRAVAGSSGTTEVDIKVKAPGGAWTSIFTTKPAIAAAAGDDASVRVGEVVANTTAPVLTSSPLNVADGTLMRMDLTGAELGSPDTLSCMITFEPQ